MLSAQQYRNFILGFSGCHALSDNRFIWLGHGKAYNDPWVIEAAIRDTPVRLSFKFSSKLPLKCCINLRPYWEALGDAGLKKAFETWVKAQYGDNAKISNVEDKPYFKPYGHPPETESTNTQDVFFKIGTVAGDDICLTSTAKVKSCSEFPALKDGITVQLTLIEAVNRILQRLR